MPKVTLPKTIIEIDIPDLVNGDTIIKRKAFFHSLNYNQIKEFVTVTWLVKHYAKNEDGTYGSYLGQFIPDKYKETVADDTTTVNAETGQIIEDLEQYRETITVAGETIPEHQVPDMEVVTVINENGDLIEEERQKVDENGNPIFITIPEFTPMIEQSIITIPYCGQYEWFNYVGENVDVNVHNMIRAYGQQVNWFENLK